MQKKFFSSNFVDSNGNIKFEKSEVSGQFFQDTDSKSTINYLELKMQERDSLASMDLKERIHMLAFGNRIKSKIDIKKTEINNSA